MCPGISHYDAIFPDIHIQPSNVKEELWPWRHISARKCKLWHKLRKLDLPDEMRDICSEFRLARRQMLVVCDRRTSLLEEERIERQQASSKVRLSFLSPESQKVRHENVRKEGKNFQRIEERMISRTSVTVKQQQNSELVKLVQSIESCKEGQEGLAKVLEEVDNHKPGTGVVIREMWQMEKESFFKDQAQNGKLRSCKFPFFKNRK